VINVIKADGKIEAFSEEKLINSIRRAGIPKSIESQVLSHIQGRLYENIPTSEIYRHIEEFLTSSHANYPTSKYSLKKAIMDLGPTGFPFEMFISYYLKAEGYETQVGQVLMGKCVKHEVDVIATKGDEKIMVECKFHNRLGVRSDLHVALYTKARFDDLKEKHGFTKAMIVTNTKVTLDALAFADCENVKVLSWSYPDQESLRDLAERYKLYPVTQLSNLSFNQKQELLSKDIVLISQICKNPDALNSTSISEDKKQEVLKEANEICTI
jgi:hypothetical protein